MLRSRVTRIVLAIAAIVLAFATLVVGAILFHFADGRRDLRSVANSLPVAERALSPAMVELLTRLEHYAAVRSYLSRRLVLEVHPRRMPLLEWHIRTYATALVLPLRLSHSERLALYCHYMAFEGGSSLLYGSRYYYQKPPSGLTLDEAIGLVVISRAPSHFSPRLHPEIFAAECARVRALLGGPA